MKKIICGAITAVCITVFSAAGISADKIVTTPSVNVSGNEAEADGIGTYYILNENNKLKTFKDFIDKYIEEMNTPKYEAVLEYAKNFIGVPYVYGGSTPSGFDCSGFVKYVLNNFDINMPRSSYEQMNVGEAVDVSEIQPGDILFFRGGGHVGFYVGDGNYLHAPQSGRTVSIDPLTRDIYCARRVFQ